MPFKVPYLFTATPPINPGFESPARLPPHKKTPLENPSTPHPVLSNHDSSIPAYFTHTPKRALADLANRSQRSTRRKLEKVSSPKDILADI